MAFLFARTTLTLLLYRCQVLRPRFACTAVFASASLHGVLIQTLILTRTQNIAAALLRSNAVWRNATKPPIVARVLTSPRSVFATQLRKPSA
jgi:hypothetical protein